MKIIFASKFYYRRAGLESYFFKLKDLLEKKGNTIVPFSTDYNENLESKYSKFFCKYYDLSKIKKAKILYNLKAFENMFFNIEAYFKVKKLCLEIKPDLFQGFGITKHLSPSVFKAAKELGIKTVMRLSDYSLMCPNSIGLDGYFNLCNDFDCATKWNLKCISRKCVKESILASTIGFFEIKGNIIFNFYKKYINYFIAPSIFLKDIFVSKFEINPNRIFHIPVFFDSAYNTISLEDENFILYAGRISREKGLKTLLEAVSMDRSLLLIIAGSGPLEEELKCFCIDKGLNVQFLGFQNFKELSKIIGRASLVVLPSECFENSPNIILEAYSHGKPVVASNIGGIPEMVLDEYTGALFQPGNAEDLLNKIHLTLPKRRDWGINGRTLLDEKFNKEKHYDMVMSIYQRFLCT